MNRKIISLIVCLNLAVFSGISSGQDLLIKNGTVLTVTQGTILNGDVLILNGIIEKIGKDLKAPEGIKIVDAAGKYVMPGIIDSHTHIALSGTNETGDAITPEVNMRDVLHAESPSIYTALSGGVTMVHTMHGSGNPIGGENIVLKMKWGKTSEEMIVPQAYRTLKFALGENPKRASSFTIGTPRYPQSRMGVNAIIRREFLKAKNYMEQWDRYLKAKKSKKAAKNIVPPRKDLQMEQLADMIRGKMVARCHSYRADETLEFIKLSKEFGFKIACFEHVSEAFKITKELVEEGVGISIFLDSWAYKVEASEGIAYNAAYCTKKGVLVSINSDSGERIRRLFNDAAKSMKYGGLSADEALKLITINPAIQLGVEKIAGSLEVGKHGDVAIFNEHPLSAYTACQMTVVEGEIYFDRAQYLKEREEMEKKKKEEEKKKGEKK
ncbi:MAG: amidohydrolase family protein [Candidatus Aminicenantes bacterium]|nr:amidohydrolase family protein [Candidatus Aminicenantes bacterium]MDH5704911.1 amidohydrolase family protein [Candidatus Aminicenantes bacterium]